MKHLPNALTLANLFCGCIAIVFALHWQPYLRELNGQDFWIPGTSQIYLAGFFILLAAIFDLFDGAAARWLDVESPIGADLDSLADVVSFGVAPSMILMKLLWVSWMQDPKAVDISMWAMCPAFLLACFGALRLARFNNAPSTSNYFTGVPIPAVGLVVASFPLIYFYNSMGAALIMTNEWFLYAIIILLSWLMNSKFKLFTLKGLMSGSFKENLLPLIWVFVSIVSLVIFRPLGVPIAFVLYILISLAMQKKLV
jgi:CDP-diacylglycerol--serine O-phosphatidyltransferase